MNQSADSSTIDRVRRKTYIERLYLLWNKSYGYNKSSSIEKAFLKESEFLRRQDDAYDFDNSTDQFLFARLAMIRHLQQQTTYLVSPEFMDAIAEKADLSVSKEYLLSKIKPDEFFVIELPYKHRHTKEKMGYKMFTKTAIVQAVFLSERKIRLLIYLPYCDESNGFPLYMKYRNPVRNGKEMESLYQTHQYFSLTADGVDWDLTPLVSDVERDGSNLFVRNVLKILLYIKSDGELDIRDEKAARDVVTSNPKKARRQILDERQFPVIHVGWGFQKSPIYQKGEWRTRGHFRWQPYDSRDNPKYKLIWIDEFLKKRQLESDSQLRDNNLN